MKGDLVECISGSCNRTFIKKNSKHKSCSGACRKAYGRELKGEKNPFSRTIKKRSELDTVRKLESNVIGESRVGGQEPKRLIDKAVEFLPNAITPASPPLDYKIERQFKEVPKRNKWRALKTVSSLFAVSKVVGCGSDVKCYAKGSDLKLGLGAIAGAGIVDLFFSKFINQNEVIEIEPIKIPLSTQEQQQQHQIWQQQQQTAERQKIELLKKRGGIITAEELMSMSFATYDMKDSFFGYLFGANPSNPLHITIYGGAGSGKSTFVLNFGRYFSMNFGPVLFLSSEMAAGETLKKALKRTKAKGIYVDVDPQQLTVKEHIQQIKENNIKLLIIDSANHIGWNANTLETIKKQCPGLSTVTILQSTKDGTYKGDSAYSFNSDVNLKLDNRKAILEKSRYLDEWDDVHTQGVPIPLNI